MRVAVYLGRLGGRSSSLVGGAMQSSCETGWHSRAGLKGGVGSGATMLAARKTC